MRLLLQELDNAVINPPALALKRRAAELAASANREMPHNQDSAALLLFYAAECGLKSAYMFRNNLRYADESRGLASSARSFVHNLMGLIHSLNIPRSSIGAPPAVELIRTGTRGDVSVLHQAWRYGEKVRDTEALCVWLFSLIEWCTNNT